MTQVNIHEKEGKWNITIYGHAENPYAEDKGNILCAAVSILGYTLMQVMRDAQERKEITVYQEHYSAGEIEIYAEAQKKEEKKIREMVSVIKTGYCLLEKEYPGKVHVVGEKKEYRA